MGDIVYGVTLTTLGLKGGVIFLAINLTDPVKTRIRRTGKNDAHLFQSMCFEKNGCRLMSSAPFAPSRLSGFRCSRAVMIVFASCDMSGGKRRGSDKIRWYMTFTFSS